MQPSLTERFRGALLGLACGDAVGTTVEFQPRGSFKPLNNMVGGGPFALNPGQWTDDTSMALCLAESLLTQNGFDAADQMGRYLKWWQQGYLSSTGECFDIGMTVSDALIRYQETGAPFAGSTDPYTAGNGSLMRLAPVVLYCFPDSDRIRTFSAQSSRTTHAAPEAIECCQLFAELIGKALKGDLKADMRRLSDTAFVQPKVAEIARGDYLGKSKNTIRGSGYCVESLEAALWCFHHTHSFEAAILEAANLGDDADTTAAIVGQLAGAHYGAQGIPDGWLAKLHWREYIETMADGLLRAAPFGSLHIGPSHYAPWLEYEAMEKHIERRA
ncbi:ADP-ribosylglycohydrolase family protein [Pseudomonas sp. PB120]|uniref:ADP-ribosylglycohydrolase family protein n=1 Tax=Pseudomonas sp. PB120 TaxID=2494700 RepID=UPI0012FE0F1C|nr:ADP-ribosylglycohydrolase family protein [Pseudomonas sp. PB120]MVV47302.1 ADP-ribosylglycohydrolase family protein [Pseudomonas sp. PB120]